MSRVLVKTDSAGWFVEAANPAGGKVRKQDGDQIFDNLIEAQEAQAVLQKAHGPNAGNGASHNEEEHPVAETKSKPKSKAATKPKADKPEPKPVTLTSDKVATGPTVEIRCQWKGKDDGDGTSGKRCENTRVIKPQDQFQVRFCLKHQKRNRSLMIAAKRRARTAARKAEAAKAAA